MIINTAAADHHSLESAFEAAKSGIADRLRPYVPLVFIRAWKVTQAVRIVSHGEEESRQVGTLQLATIERSIHVIRGQRVMLDSDLAALVWSDYASN